MRKHTDYQRLRVRIGGNARQSAETQRLLASSPNSGNVCTRTIRKHTEYWASSPNRRNARAMRKHTEYYRLQVRIAEMHVQYIVQCGHRLRGLESE